MKKGYVALISTIVVGAIGTAVAVSLLLLGTMYSQTSLVVQQSNQAKAITNACAEDALQQIRNNNAYIGTNNLSFSGIGTCNYTVTNNGGENRKIISSGNVNQNIRKIEIIINQLNPKIIISSWQELANFN